MTLSADEFIRRFLLHSLQPAFQRIRHYGLLASRPKRANLALYRQYLNAPPVVPSPAPGTKAAVKAQLMPLRTPQPLLPANIPVLYASIPNRVTDTIPITPAASSGFDHRTFSSPGRTQILASTEYLPRPADENLYVHARN